MSEANSPSYRYHWDKMAWLEKEPCTYRLGQGAGKRYGLVPVGSDGMVDPEAMSHIRMGLMGFLFSSMMNEIAVLEARVAALEPRKVPKRARTVTHVSPTGQVG